MIGSIFQYIYSVPGRMRHWWSGEEDTAQSSVESSKPEAYTAQPAVKSSVGTVTSTASKVTSPDESMTNKEAAQILRELNTVSDGN